MKQYQQELLLAGEPPGWAGLLRAVGNAGTALTVRGRAPRCGRTVRLRHQEACLRSEPTVVSLERDAAVAFQRRTSSPTRGIDRVCLIEGDLSATMARKWRQTCDWFDAILVLSVAHWFDDPAEVVGGLAALGAQVFVELPSARDAGACGARNRAPWTDLSVVRRVSGRTVVPLQASVKTLG